MSTTSRRSRTGPAPARPADRRRDPPGRRRSCAATRASVRAGASRRSSCASRRRRSCGVPPARPDRAARRRRVLEPRRRRGLQGAWSRSPTTACCPGSTGPASSPTSPSTSATSATRRSRTDPRVIAALARRGITDLDRVLFDTWTYGAPARARAVPRPPGRLARRLAPRRGRTRNPYANPVSGLHFVVDMNTMELLEIEDTGAVDRPRTMGEYVPEHVPGLRAARRPQAARDHASRRACRSRLDGNLLRWQRWSMRLGFNYREGLVLHRVGYEDGGRVRPVAHRHVVRRDGRALPRPDARPLAAHRVRHRRVGPRLHDHLARARLRLPRRDPLPRRRACTTRRASRRRSATRSASTRRTTPSCGSTSTRGPAPRCGGRAGSWSPSTPPSPTTSTSSTGASTRTATSSARCAPPGSW